MRAARLGMFALLASVAFAQSAAAVPQFFVKEPLTVPRRLAGLAVGDLNGDDIDDIAVISRGNNKISIVLVDSDANFRQGASIILGSRLKSVGIGDFNSDGKGDLVVVTGSRNIYIVPGNGDGTFLTARKIRRCCPGEGVVVGDFDNSRPGAKYGDDFVITNPQKDDISLFLNRDVAGGIEFNTERRLRAGNKPLLTNAADFNNDGFQDVCALNVLGSGNDVSIFVNNGDAGPGTFRSVANFFAGRRARSIAIGDMNKDGEEDIVAGDQLNNSISILPNLGGGFFGTSTALPVSCVQDEAVTPVPCKLRALQVADFDKDGNNDLAVLMSGINVVRVFQGDAAGGVNNAIGVPSVGLDARFMLLGNFNGDAKPDLLVGSKRDTSIRLVINISTTGTDETATPTATGPTRTPTPTNPNGTSTPSRTPTECRGQGCDCDPENGDDDCNAPFFCAANDEICCDTPCDVEDASCALPGFEGTCKPINLPNGEECMVNEQCDSNFCVDGFCCNSACTGNTEHCNVTPGQCIDNGIPELTPTRTPTPLVTPTTRLKELGEDCTGGTECRSTFCPSEDLVCCENACNGTNEACDLPTVEGQCLPINLPDNDPCSVDAQCISQVCEGGLCRGLATRTPTRTGSAAPTATGTPQKGPTGAVCTSGDECDSGFCPEEDEVCCNEPCDGPNERCDLPDAMGICTEVDLPDGSTCTLAQQCQSRICEGNICRSAQSRTPTATRTATPNRQPTLILARGSGCSAGDGESSGLGSVAMLLMLPAAWWLLSSRRPAVRVRRRQTRR